MSGAPTADEPVEARREPSSLELRDATGAPIYQLQRAPKDDATRTRPAVEIDARGVESLLAQVPQAALSALLLHQASGHVVLSVAPHLMAELSAGTARFMRATTGGFRGNIVDGLGTVIGQASFAPVSMATLGVVAVWQIVSFAVAQKHLYDINVKLDRIGQSVSELRHLMDHELVATLQGDAEHLHGFARALRDEMDLASRRRSVDEIFRSARSRHKQLVERVDGVTGVARKFTPDRTAKLFGQTMLTAAKGFDEDIDKLITGLVAVRFNALLMAAACEVLQRMGEAPSYVEGLECDIDRMVSDDDALFDRVLGRVDHSVMSLRSYVRTEKTDASERTRLASRVWVGATAAAGVRREVARLRDGAPTELPKLLLGVEEDRKISSIAWIDAPAEAAAVG